jgi:glycosyltransferase involved in cell wall biosynthesis
MKWYKVYFGMLCLLVSKLSAYDLTVVGQIKFAASLSRLSLGIIECLKDRVSINVIPTPGNYDLTDVPESVKKIIQKDNKKPGRVALLTDILWHAWDTPSAYVPTSFIKIAYSMIEGTAIPPMWVNILNSEFDAVAVPDEFCKGVYKNSGVKIPIFVIPCGMCSDELFEKPLKSEIHKPFTFGISAEFVSRKNFDVLIEAFVREFRNNPEVKLKIHGRGGDYIKRIEWLIAKHELKNVEVINKKLTRAEYVDFLLSLDCYVLLSKGEGFSLTPREALALGIPCILTDNSAQRAICATGFVKVVPSKIQEGAFYACFDATVGSYANCKIEDASKALREVYKHYDKYLAKARNARPWVSQYLYKNLKEYYLALVKPKKVVLADVDTIERGVVKTTSKKLYRKYAALLKGSR